MSAVPATRPQIESLPTIRRQRSRPSVTPTRRRQAQTRVNVLPVVAARSVLFGAIAGAVFFASSLTGNVLMENARREGLAATARAREAKREEAAVRRQLDALTGLGAIETWASAHGFQAPDALVQPSVRGTTLVASNR